MDISRVFPQSFDISDPLSEEFKDFKEEFKFTFVVSYLNLALQSSVNFFKQNFERAIICLAIVERRINVLSGRCFQDPQFSPSELDSVTDGMYEFLSKPNMEIDLTRTSFYRPLQRRFADV